MILFFVFMLASCARVENSNPNLQKQNPSPMVDNTRKHERVPHKDYPGTLWEVRDVLSKPVELFIPQKNRNQQPYFLLIHFHGHSYVPRFGVTHSKYKFILATVNLGAGSSIYESEFIEEDKFISFLDQLKKHILEKEKIGIEFNGVFLSGFSAGYGAIRAILRQEKNINRIKGVILLDGLHTDYIPEKTPLHDGGKLNEDKLKPFLKFARLAVAKHKKFLFTHSEIFPGTYASTTETADYLIERLQLKNGMIKVWCMLHSSPRVIHLLATTR